VKVIECDEARADDLAIVELQRRQPGPQAKRKEEHAVSPPVPRAAAGDLA
jgi:hypothetical protein